MAQEIERKYLVTDDTYKTMAHSSSHIMQAYVAREERGVVRVRIKDDRAYLTVKSRNNGMRRDEWEYEIPLDDARQIMERISDGNVIDKIRYYVDFEGYTWEVDAFMGHLEGLCVAEIELPSEDVTFAIPPFIGREVTGQRRFYNSVLLELKSPRDLNL